MKKTIIDGISQRLLNDKMRRMLLTGALYQLLAEANDKEPDLVSLNSALGFLQDPRGFLLSQVLAKYWKSKEVLVHYRRIPEERLERYLLLVVPHWLRYSPSGKYDLEQDVKKIVGMVTA